MKLVDAHTHLNGDELYPQWQEHLSAFVQAWGIWLLNSWASDIYNVRGIEIAQQASGCFVKASIGYHPWCCDDGEINWENIQQKIIDLKQLYTKNKEYIGAIGECGIDTYYPGSETSLSLQKQLFILQCDLARELDLPLVVHIRKDFDTGLEILRNYSDLSIHFHCFSFWPDEIGKLQALKNKKLFIGFCGNVTYKNAQNLRDSLAKVPLDQLLLETDAPRLSPQAVRGTINFPVNIWHTYLFVAEYLHIDLQTLADHLEKNFTAFYVI